MDFSLVYLAGRLFYRIREFIYDWYAGGFLRISHFTISVLEGFDRTLAFKITLKNLFQPLYQDHSIIGHVFGFIFRSFRILIGLLIYPIIIFIGFAIYLVWAAIPLYIIYRGFFF